MTYVWITCGVLFLVAGGVLGNTILKRKAEEEKIRLYEESLKNLRDEFLRFDPQKEGDAKQILDLGAKQENKDLYKRSKIEGDVVKVMTVAQRTIDNATERKDMTERLAQLESGSANAESLPIDQIKTMRRTATDLNEKASIMDDDYRKRLADVRDRLDKSYLTSLIRDAKAKGNTREALTAFTMAEIEIRNALDTTLRGKVDPERKKWYTDLFKQLVTDSDAAATTVFTQSYIDGEAWKDGLTADDKSWTRSQEGISGFSLKDGMLQVVGPKAGSGKNGIISIGDREQLKDIVAHIEFTPVKGNVVFYFRLYNRADNNVPNYGIRTMGNNAEFKPGQSYSMDVSMIGSNFVVKFPNTDITAHEEPMAASKQRYGAIGVEFAEDSEVKFTVFKYKELRSNKKP